LALGMDSPQCLVNKKYPTKLTFKIGGSNNNICENGELQHGHTCKMSP